MARIDIKTAQAGTAADTWHELENVSGPFGIIPITAAVQLCIGYTVPSAELATTILVGEAFKRKLAPTGPVYVKTASTGRVSWYSVLASSTTLPTSPYSAYAVLSLEPDLVLDFASEYYRTSGADTTLASATTYTGASNGTMTDSDGLLKWKPHNLLYNSGDLAGSGWSNNSMTVGAVTTGSPFGTYQTVSPSSTIAGASSRYQIGHPLTGGTTYVGWALVKYSAGNGWFVIDMYDSGKDSERCWFDLQNGVVGSKEALIIDHGMINYGDGWWLCWASSASTNVSGGLSLEVPTGDGVLASNSGDVVLVAGSQFNRSDLGGMVNNPATASSYVPTTSAAVYLPRTGNHVYNGTAWVNEGLLLESEPRTNLLTYSNDFTDVSWTKSAATVATSTTVTGSDGQFMTELAPPSTASIAKLLGYNISLSAATDYTFSIDLKEGVVRYAILRMYDSSGRRVSYTVDTSNGTVTQTDTAGTVTNSINIVDLGSGLYRYYVTFNFAAVDTSQQVSVALSNTATPTLDAYGGLIYAGAVTDVLNVGLAQLEVGSTPSSYIPTAGATVTRAAETLTVAAADMPWPTPVETTGTELVTNGTFDTDTDWTKGTGVTISGGVVNATSATTIVTQTMSLVSNSSYSVSFDYTMSAGDSLRVEGSSILATSPALGASGTVTLTIAANSTTFKIAADGATFTGTIDNISVKEINPPSVSIQMDGRMTYADTSSGEQVVFYNWASGATTYVKTVLDTSGARTGQVSFFQREAVDGQFLVSTGNTTYAPDISVPFNIAARNGSTFVNGAVDGVALTASAGPSVLADFSATDFRIGSTLMGNIGGLRVWADDLADAGIAEASAPSLEPSLSLIFDGSSLSFTVTDWSE